MTSQIVSQVEAAAGLHYRHPRLPLNVKLPDNLECGTKLYIHGGVVLHPDRFSINLKDGGADANKYFHFNPRFGDSPVVVRNSLYNGSWGSEEKEGDSPFAPGQDFLIGIQATVDGYEIEVNGAHFTTYKHRDEMPLCNVTHMTISGDIVCYGVHVPLSSLPIPLTLSIPGKTCIGDLFFIDGEVPGGSDRFDVNMQCGGEDNADVMFHLNPRFGDSAVVCNSKCSGSWDNEEREGLPLSVGDLFNLCVAASSEAYHTFLNRTPLVKFNHRLNMASACTLAIRGDVKVSNICIDCPPSKLPPLADINTAKDYDSAVSTFFPGNPAMLTLPGALEPGNVLVFSGIVSTDASRLKLNLQCGSSSDDDIALHINPRWDSDDGPVLVFNSREGGEWGEEVREPNHISPGSRIEIQLACMEDGYCVSVNGFVAVKNFGHRLASAPVHNVVVDGSVVVERLIAA